MNYHEERELIQSLKISRIAGQVLEAIMERGAKCWESQQSIAARKRISRSSVQRAIRELTAEHLILSRQRGLGQTNVYSIDWQTAKTHTEHTSRCVTMTLQEASPCNIQKRHHDSSRSVTMTLQEASPCNIPIESEMNSEMNNEPPSERAGVDVHVAELENAARLFYSHRATSPPAEAIFTKDVALLVDFTQHHSLESVLVALKKLPGKLGLSSDRKYLCGCRIALAELLAAEVRRRSAAALSESQRHQRCAINKAIDERHLAGEEKRIRLRRIWAAKSDEERAEIERKVMASPMLRSLAEKAPDAFFIEDMIHVEIEKRLASEASDKAEGVLFQ